MQFDIPETAPDVFKYLMKSRLEQRRPSYGGDEAQIFIIAILGGEIIFLLSF